MILWILRKGHRVLAICLIDIDDPPCPPTADNVALHVVDDPLSGATGQEIHAWVDEVL